MNRKYGLRISLVCWLTAVWVLLWGTLSPANILAGLAVALLITLLLPAVEGARDAAQVVGCANN